MLSDETPKELFLNGLLEDVLHQPIPTLEGTMAEYDRMTNLHGIKFDYEKHEVLIEYKVVPGLYEPKRVSFSYFETVVEGILCCRRKRKW